MGGCGIRYRKQLLSAYLTFFITHFPKKIAPLPQALPLLSLQRQGILAGGSSRRSPANDPLYADPQLELRAKRKPKLAPRYAGSS